MIQLPSPDFHKGKQKYWRKVIDFTTTKTVILIATHERNIN